MTTDSTTTVEEMTRALDRLVAASYDLPRPATVAESEVADVVAGCLRELRSGLTLLAGRSA